VSMHNILEESNARHRLTLLRPARRDAGR